MRTRAGRPLNRSPTMGSCLHHRRDPHRHGRHHRALARRALPRHARARHAREPRRARPRIRPAWGAPTVFLRAPPPRLARLRPAPLPRPIPPLCPSPRTRSGGRKAATGPATRRCQRQRKPSRTTRARGAATGRREATGSPGLRRATRPARTRRCTAPPTVTGPSSCPVTAGRRRPSRPRPPSLRPCRLPCRLPCRQCGLRACRRPSPLWRRPLLSLPWRLSSLLWRLLSLQQRLSSLLWRRRPGPPACRRPGLQVRRGRRRPRPPRRPTPELPRPPGRFTTQRASPGRLRFPGRLTRHPVRGSPTPPLAGLLAGCPVPFLARGRGCQGRWGRRTPPPVPRRQVRPGFRSAGCPRPAGPPAGWPAIRVRLPAPGRTAQKAGGGDGIPLSGVPPGGRPT